MCEPLSLGLLTAAATVASAGVSYVTQQNAVKKQEEANNQWAQYQQQQRAAENVRQEEFRKKAEGERQKTLGEIDPAVQAREQQTEEQRLATLYGADPAQGEYSQAQINDMLLSGQASGGTEFQTDIARRINTASQDARKRIQALATMQSFGDSFGGLGTSNQLKLNEGNNALKLVNDQRQGSLSAYGAAQAVDPVKYGAVSNPWGGVASSLASIAGSNLGKSFAKA